MTMAGVMVIALCADWDEWGMKVSLEHGLSDAGSVSVRRFLIDAAQANGFIGH
ncbi:hypothetical protein PSYPI_13636 [Pseudomonas syringae pv. pisi str. 1704B]|uniref:Uncharacterized protein n=1 Tax=Pseudomonas syringae pv. pisi str. 1704B TaxID=629263 RepID=F3G8H1_PSESJ|nr:hypothetical protein PSYPI_13636 [Pseudomonas syringae pv. pisi str. 1704B]